LIAAQRAAGVAFAGTLKEQPKPSAERPAANAALVALMQNTNSAAAAISIINLMAILLFGARGFCTRTRHALPENATNVSRSQGFRRDDITKAVSRGGLEIGPVLA
jgi:hypothetical protein